jgi:hypothetical protein
VRFFIGLECYGRPTAFSLNRLAMKPSNDHLKYALTCYGHAPVLVVVFLNGRLSLSQGLKRELSLPCKLNDMSIISVSVAGRVLQKCNTKRKATCGLRHHWNKAVV